ncbi:MAG: hypothetical protein KBT22_11550 [Bacteroidales bacterium]|nr:hypothetical protein [Candidatus Scybalocola fimicaballi]
MKLRILHFLLFCGCLCGQATFATENNAVESQNAAQTYTATFGEDIVHFSTQNAQQQFVKMTKKYRAYQQYAEKISIDLTNTLKETREELAKTRDAATNDKGCDTKRALSHLTKLKNQLEDMFEASQNMRKAYNHVSQMEIALSGMNLSNDDTGERNRYWDDCKEAFNNCIDAIKEGRNDVDQKRDEYLAQITNVINSKK